MSPDNPDSVEAMKNWWASSNFSYGPRRVVGSESRDRCVLKPHPGKYSAFLENFRLSGPERDLLVVPGRRPEPQKQVLLSHRFLSSQCPSFRQQELPKGMRSQHPLNAHTNSLFFPIYRIVAPDPGQPRSTSPSPR